MSDQFPEGALITVTLELRLPKAATEEEIDDWLNFSVMQRGGISLQNPLVNTSPEGFGTFDISWEWGRMVGRREEYDIVPTENGGRRYKVRYHRERSIA